MMTNECSHSHADTFSPDGPMMEKILQNATLLDELTEPLDHPMRYGKLSVDSHHVKEKIGTYIIFDYLLSDSRCYS